MPVRFYGIVVGASLALTLALPAKAQEVPVVDVPAGTYAVDPNHARLTWSVDHLGVAPYSARFDGFTMRLQFDPQRIQSTALEASVDPRSVDTGYSGPEDWDGELALSAEYLDASNHPAVTYRSTGIVRTGPRSATLNGDLTLLGVTRPMRFDVTYVGSAREHGPAAIPTIGFVAVGTFDRTAHGLTHLAPPEPGAKGIGPVVTVRMEAEFMLEDEQ